MHTWLLENYARSTRVCLSVGVIYRLARTCGIVVSSQLVEMQASLLM